MEAFLDFCRSCLKLDVSKLESYKRRQVLRSILALLSTLETKLSAVLNKGKIQSPLTPATSAWLAEFTQSIKTIVELLETSPPRRTFFQSLLVWCSNRASVEELEEEKRGRRDAGIEVMVDEVLCRGFAILDRLYDCRKGRVFEIRKDMDLKQAKLDFLGCSCELRHQVEAASNDVPLIRNLAQRIFEDHLKWFQKEIQFEKKCTSVSYQWQLFSLKHQLGNAIIEKEDIIDSQQTQIDELNVKLEQAMNNCVSHRPKDQCTAVH